MRLLPRHEIAARWRALSFDDRVGMLVATVAIAVAAAVGTSHAYSQPVYGPIDEVSHTAYAFHVGAFGVPPVLGRDRAFLGRKGVDLGSRDVDIPRPEASSAPIPLGPHGEFGQVEAIQAPLYYYVVAPLTWFGTGDGSVVALRLAGVLMVAISVLLAFVAVIELTGDALAGGVAAMVLGTISGVTDFLSQVQNDALLLPLSGAIFWLFSRAIRRKTLTWPLTICCGAIAITQVVAIPLAALAVLVAGGLELRRNRHGVAVVALKSVVAGLPIFLWIATNHMRYGSLLPHDVSLAPGGLFQQNNDQILHLHELAYPVLNAIIGGAYLYIQASPYGADYRHLSLLIPLVLIGTGIVCALRPLRYRQALGYTYVMVGVTIVTIFGVVAASLIGTGGDLAAMQIHRYYMPTYFAASCMAGIAGGGVSTRLWVRRAVLVSIPMVQAYWAINGSTLT